MRSRPGSRRSNAGDDASVVYHEYTHGLSGRLVTYPNGLSALNSWESGAMGEAWSDWYALDLLVEQGFITDTAADGEVMMGKWITGGSGIRYQAIDCSVGASGNRCPGAYATGPGGFTFGDYGRVYRGPEVHSDGEIWAQTLWDLRDALGVTDARRLITRAMELSPPDPSFLDMRNAILQADLVANGGANADDAVEGLPASRDGVLRLRRGRQRHDAGARRPRAALVQGRPLRLARRVASPIASPAPPWRTSASRSAGTARGSRAPTSPPRPMRGGDS